MLLEYFAEIAGVLNPHISLTSVTLYLPERSFFHRIVQPDGADKLHDRQIGQRFYFLIKKRLAQGKGRRKIFFAKAFV